MPPEQAAGEGDRVGPWSDIYSTGAILYELLTGRPPFRAASPFETVRQVIENEPVSPRLVNPSIPKDIETICLKCLQKDPTKRYTTSKELAEELQRFLLGEPIKARPIGRVARFWKLCRRNPRTASAIAAAALCGLIAVIGLGVGFVQTLRALAAKRESIRLAVDANKKSFTIISESTLLNQHGVQPVRKQLLEQALVSFEDIERNNADDPVLIDVLAEVHYFIGQINDLLGQKEKALEHFKIARQTQESSLTRSPNDPVRLQAYGNTVNAMGAYWVVKQQFDAARSDIQRAIEIRLQLTKLDPENVEYQRTLANSYMNLGTAADNEGKIDEARKFYNQAQEIRSAALKLDPNHVKLRSDQAKCFFNLGNLAFDEGSYGVAGENFRAAADIFAQLAAKDKDDLSFQMLLSLCYTLLGDTASSQDNGDDEAREWYRKAIDVLQPLARRNPDVPEYGLEQAAVLMSVGGLESRANNPQYAIDAFEQAHNILAALVQEFPNVTRCQRELAVVLRVLGVEQRKQGNSTAGDTNLAESRRLLEALGRQFPGNEDLKEQLDLTIEALAGTSA
jgi:tetratricopeptide (TPR) repeat protein